MKLNYNKREVESLGEKRTSCPLCKSTVDDGYKKCFHCSNCGYLQCCDYDGYYDKHCAKIW